MVYIKCWNRYIEPSDGFPWNGWEVDSEVGYEQFVAGIRWMAYKHLAGCSECRRINRLTTRQIAKALREIEKEWEEITQR
jgi:hypothetical protein